MKELISRERLAELFDYDATLGQFIRKASRGLGRANDVAGYVMPSGYRQMCVDGHMYYAHRLAWLWLHGEHPADQIDHINGVKSDNRPENIRAATRGENQQNLTARKNNTSGYPGVVRLRGIWRAGIKVGGKFKSLGMYTSAEEAAAAYLAGKAKYHQFCPTVRAA